MAVFKFRNSKFWWVSVYRGGGKPRLRLSTGKEDKGEAEAVERVLRLAHAGKSTPDKLHAMIDALTGGQHDGLPLSSVWDEYSRWMRSVGKELSVETERKRRRAVERLADWAASNWPSAKHAAAVDRSCALGFAEWLAGAGTSGKTRRNVIADLGTVWEGLRRIRDDVISNPWPLVLPVDDSERLFPFTPAEERAVLEAADKIGKGWGLACRISRYTGLRYGDVARLRWDAVDFKAGVIRLKPSKTARHAIGVVLPVCKALGEALSVVREGAGGSPEFVLPEHALAYPKPEQGEPGPFSLVLLKAGVRGRHTFHSWRHTFRTRLAEAGVSDEIAKRLGGWTVDKTALRYDHDGRVAELAAAVEAGATVGGVCGK
jgi:integrase